MTFETKCPYCHSGIKKIIVPIVPELRMYGYIFSCDCIKNQEDLMNSDEEKAYQNYLKIRG